MIEELLKELAGQGVVGVFAAIFVYMFWTFLKKYIKNTEEQTKVLAINSKILEQNTKVMTELKTVLSHYKKESV